MNNFTKLKKDFENKSFTDQLAILEEYITIENPLNTKQGIYMLEDFYIGKSKNIKSRVLYHVLEVINMNTAEIVYNRDKLNLIKTAIISGKLNVKIIDSDMSKEVFYIKKFYNELPLTNKEFVTKRMIADKKLKNKIKKSPQVKTRQRNTNEKGIESYEYIAIKSGKVKVIFSKLENWVEKSKAYKKPIIKGFKTLILAREWLYNKKIIFVGE